jgi:hypothetical protein
MLGWRMIKLMAVLVLFAVACGGDDVSPAIDAALDARVDAVPVDAPTDAMVDAPVNPRIAPICMAICAHIYTDCLMETEEPDCQEGCNPDLLDCSETQLDALEGCATVACPEGADPVGECLDNAGCVDG